jgi:hypothetical protein
MQMDEKSISQVGKSIHRQLSSLSKRLEAIGEQNRRVYQGIGQSAVTAWRSALGTIVTGAPLMGSALSAVAGSATMLAGSLYSVGQSSGALLPVITSLGLAGLTASIGMRNFGAAVNETNPKALKELLADMPKSMQEAVMSTRAMSKEMRAVIWEKMFVGVGGLMKRLEQTGVIQRGLGLMAEQINVVARSVLRYMSSAEGVSVLNKFFANNAKVFGALGKAVVPFLNGFLRLVNALTPAALRFANGLTDVGKRFESWTKGEGFAKRIDESMKGAQKTAGLLWNVLSNLGNAVRNVFNAANPATNTFLQMLVDVTQRFEDWTSSVGGQNSIAKWAAQSVDVMRQLGHTIEAVFKVVAELADPRVISSFLKTLEGAFNILAKLPLDKMVTAFVNVSEALQPVSSVFLAIIIAGAGLNIMIGSLLGQFGGLFSVLSKIIKFKILTNILKGMGGGGSAAAAGAGQAAAKGGLLARAWGFLVGIFNKVKAALSGVLGFFNKTSATTAKTASTASRLGSAFKPVLSILGRFAKFAGPVGIAIWIGTIIAKSKDLQAKLGGTWDAIQGVWANLMTAFKEIGTALKPLAPAAKGVGKAFGFVFGLLDKIAGFAIGVVIDTITYAFKSLGNVIKGAGRIIAGIINVLVGLFTLDFGKVWDGLKQMFSGIGPLLQGAFGLFITFFAPARLAKIGLGAIKGLLGGLKGAMPGVLSGIGTLITRMLKFFVDLAPKLLSLGWKALQGIGSAIVKYVPKAVMFMGKLYLGIIKWILKLPGKLLDLGQKALSNLGGAVIKNTPKILAAAGRIYLGIIRWIMKLPGKLLELGASAISKLGSAVSKGVGTLKNIAGNIVESVVNTIKQLPGKLLNLAGSLLSAGKTLGGKILEGIRNGITAIGDMAGRVASDLKNGINNAIGLPKSLSFSVLGKKIGFTIPGFEKGTPFAPGGLALVGEGGPELVSLRRGSRVYNNRDTQKMMQPEATRVQFPSRLILRIGNRDFEAYVSEIADDRIDASDNLAWQGA